MPSPEGAMAFTPLTPGERQVKAALTALVRQENQAILSGDDRRLKAVFLPGGASRDALKAARERENFLWAWSRARRLRVTAVATSLRTPHITFRTPERVQVFAVVSEDYTYHYLGAEPEHKFGLGVRHDYLLVRRGGRFYIRADYFTDPLDQDTRIPQSAVPESAPAPLNASHPRSVEPAGHAAVAYADRYCGAAPGCGNKGLYNPQYNNYNGEGGDCTNFISQALSASGLRQTGAWNYSRRLGGGTRAWTNAEGLRDYLAGSERADIFASGRYGDVTRPTPDFPLGAVGALQPGDLISYIERGTAVHTGMVVAVDGQGVPLVDTHTSDRFHVPWDLGWDRTTRYLFWHVHYPRLNLDPSAHSR